MIINMCVIETQERKREWIFSLKLLDGVSDELGNLYIVYGQGETEPVIGYYPTFGWFDYDYVSTLQQEAQVELSSGFSDNQFGTPEFSSISAYSWYAEDMIYQQTWNEYLNSSVHLSAGLLADNPAIGYPMGEFEGSGAPAMLIEPDELSPEISCSNTDLITAYRLNHGVFADWSSLVQGADTYVLPSERQCMAWDDAGDPFPFGDFPTSNFGGDTESSPISSTALGNLDGTGNADVLFSTVLDGDWTLIGLNSDGNELTSIGFPFTLPENVSAGGGFAIADLDRDGKVEIVFGTSDGLLHCWELGSCSTGYAPWCQFQHDCGRSGVLE